MAVQIEAMREEVAEDWTMLRAVRCGSHGCNQHWLGGVFRRAVYKGVNSFFCFVFLLLMLVLQWLSCNYLLTPSTEDMLWTWEDERWGLENGWKSESLHCPEDAFFQPSLKQTWILFKDPIGLCSNQIVVWCVTGHNENLLITLYLSGTALKITRWKVLLLLSKCLINVWAKRWL